SLEYGLETPRQLGQMVAGNARVESGSASASCSSHDAAEPVPPRPVFWMARCSGVEPLLFLPRASAPFTRRARTAAAQRVRTARCKGATPLLSSEFGFAPALIKNSTVTYCDSGSHASDPGIPSTA